MHTPCSARCRTVVRAVLGRGAGVDRVGENSWIFRPTFNRGGRFSTEAVSV